MRPTAIDCEHPWDQQLRGHVSRVHRDALAGAVALFLGSGHPPCMTWDVYKAALSVQERRSIPLVGPSTERRAFEYTARVYNDDTIRSLICFACAQIKVDTGRLRSAIDFRSGIWLFTLPPGSLTKNFSMAEFSRRYRRPGTPLAASGRSPSDAGAPDFTDWEIRLRPNTLELLSRREDGLSGVPVKEIAALASDTLLCCP